MDGPYEYHWYVPGSPVAWKRPREGRSGNKRWRFTDPLVSQWQEVVKQHWMVAKRPFFDGPLSVQLDFAIDRGNSKRSYPPQDCDNLAKAVLDALNGLAFKDDSQIIELIITKRYGDKPGVTIKLGA